MATPMTADRLVQALRAEGLRVIEHRSWRTHNRNHIGQWGPVNGVMIHHTVTSGTARTVELCYQGHRDLPGPLCHGVIAKDGTVYLVGHGRANHAGMGDDDVLRAVIAERDQLPPDDDLSIDGNRHFYGFECENLGDGRDPWPAEQLEAIERSAAAVCRVHGWDHRSVLGHLEWQVGKVDPRGFSMDQVRYRISERLAAPPEPPTQEQPAPTKPKHQPYPGADFFKMGRRSPIITAMGQRLVSEGCGRYTVGPGPEWTEADERSYAAWQRKLGYVGRDADGTPGKTSWDKLRVPHV